MESGLAAVLASNAKVARTEFLARFGVLQFADRLPG